MMESDMVRCGRRKVTLEIPIKMGWSRMGLEARRPAGGGVVGALVRKGRDSSNGVNATYLKDTKRVKKAGLND